jgi:hypothetical protein
MLVPVRNDDQAFEEHYHSLYSCIVISVLAASFPRTWRQSFSGRKHFPRAFECSLQLFKQEYTSRLLISVSTSENGVKNFSYKVI